MEQEGGKKNWMKHVMKTMKQKKISLKQAMKEAKKTYKGGALAPMPLNGGRRKTRRGGRKH